MANAKKEIYAPGVYGFEVRKGNRVIDDFYQLRATNTPNVKEKLNIMGVVKNEKMSLLWIVRES